MSKKIFKSLITISIFLLVILKIYDFLLGLLFIEKSLYVQHPYYDTSVYQMMNDAVVASKMPILSTWKPYQDKGKYIPDTKTKRKVLEEQIQRTQQETEQKQKEASRYLSTYDRSYNDSFIQRMQERLKKLNVKKKSAIDDLNELLAWSHT